MEMNNEVQHLEVCLDDSKCANMDSCNKIHYSIPQLCNCGDKECPSMFPKNTLSCTGAREAPRACSKFPDCTFGDKCKFSHDICSHGYVSGKGSRCPYHAHWRVLDTLNKRVKGESVAVCKITHDPAHIGSTYFGPLGDGSYGQQFFRTCHFLHRELGECE